MWCTRMWISSKEEEVQVAACACPIPLSFISSTGRADSLGYWKRMRGN
jgi:hypothetical protein